MVSIGTTIAGIVVAIVAGLAGIQDTVSATFEGLTIGGATISIGVVPVITNLEALANIAVAALGAETIVEAGVKIVGILIVTLFP
jgi:hypothetical protein